MRPLLVAVSLFALCGCGGDPRDPFLGMYEGEGVYLVQWAGDPAPQRLDFLDRIYISPSSADARRVFTSELCGLSAILKDANTLQFEATQCATYKSNDCDVSESVGEGTAKLAGNQLEIAYVGDLIAQCPTGETFTATSSTTVSATRQ